MSRRPAVEAERDKQRAIEMLVAGKSTGEIAVELGLSRRTVQRFVAGYVPPAPVLKPQVRPVVKRGELLPIEQCKPTESERRRRWEMEKDRKQCKENLEAAHSRVKSVAVVRGKIVTGEVSDRAALQKCGEGRREAGLRRKINEQFGFDAAAEPRMVFHRMYEDDF